MEEEPPWHLRAFSLSSSGAEGWSSSPQEAEGLSKAWPFIWEWPQAAAGRRTGLREGRMCGASVSGKLPCRTPGALSHSATGDSAEPTSELAWLAGMCFCAASRYTCSADKPHLHHLESRRRAIGWKVWVWRRASLGLRLLYFQPPRSLWGQQDLRGLAQGRASTGRLDLTRGAALSQGRLQHLALGCLGRALSMAAGREAGEVRTERRGGLRDPTARTRNEPRGWTPAQGSLTDRASL